MSAISGNSHVWNLPDIDHIERVVSLFEYGLIDEEILEALEAGSALTLTDADDYLIVQSRSSVVVDGGGGRNRITTTVDDDIYFGGSDRDIISGQNGDDLLIGAAGDDFLQGYLHDDVLLGGEGNDLLLGWAGNDLVLGGEGNDTVEGTQGNDFVFGGAGNDVIRVESWAGEPEIARFPNADKVQPEEPLEQKQVLVGGSGSDRFEFRWLIDAKPQFIEKWTRPDGSVDFRGVASENTNLHDHWVETMGHEIVVADYNPEEDSLLFIGHTVTLTEIDYVDADGDGEIDDSVVSFHSTNPPATHDQDDLGSITFLNNLLGDSEIEIWNGVFNGVRDKGNTHLFSEVASTGPEAPVFFDQPQLIGKKPAGDAEASAAFFPLFDPEDNGRKIFDFSAEDPKGLPLSWSISGEDAHHFKINANGVLYVQEGLDSLITSTDGDDIFSVEVKITNSEGGASATEFNFKVERPKPNAVDQDVDAAPVFILDSHEVANALAETISPEGEANEIRQFVALDMDGNPVTYALSGEDADNPHLVFDPWTGALTARRGLDVLGRSADGDGTFELLISAVDDNGDSTNLNYSFEVA